MMKDEDPKYKIFSRDVSDRLVRAWVADAAGNGFHPFSFSVTAVDGVVGVNEKSSALVLRSGIKIAVALPYEELEEKIYAPDFREPILDLCPVTGEAAREVIAPDLARKINAEAAPESLKITAFLRKEQSMEFVACSFSETDITGVNPFKTSKSICGETLTIRFNAAVTMGPFGTGSANLDMPHDDFIQWLSYAKTNRHKTLDLCKLFADNPKKYGINLG